MRFCSRCAVVALCCAFVGRAAIARAAQFWLSPSGNVALGASPPATAAGLPVVGDIGVNASGSLYVWGRPDPGESLLRWTLRTVATDASILKFTTSAVEPFNPVLGQTPAPNSLNQVRWEETFAPVGRTFAVTNQPTRSMLDDLRGFSLPELPVERTARGPGNQRRPAGLRPVL